LRTQQLHVLILIKIFPIRLQPLELWVLRSPKNGAANTVMMMMMMMILIRSVCTVCTVLVDQI